MRQTPIKRKVDRRPSPEDAVIKSCIMHVRHNDTCNERRGMLLCGGEIMTGMGEWSSARRGHHGDGNMAAGSSRTEY